MENRQNLGNEPEKQPDGCTPDGCKKEQKKNQFNKLQTFECLGITGGVMPNTTPKV